MKFYIYALIIFVALAFSLAGCTQQRTNESVSRENPATSKDKPANEETGKSPQPAQTGPEEPGSENLKEITVYKSPTCGCCTMWEEHLTKARFKVTSNKTDDMVAVRKRLGVPEKAQSCHTAVVGGYVIEGHVPAADVEKLLKARPADIAGLSAPGMPPKSPGMQPEGEKPAGYDVLSFDRQGQTKVFTSY